MEQISFSIPPLKALNNKAYRVLGVLGELTFI
nr:MAG TPA: hypothetical protein [Bacteriophage sp.]